MTHDETKDFDTSTTDNGLLDNAETLVYFQYVRNINYSLFIRLLDYNY